MGRGLYNVPKSTRTRRNTGTDSLFSLVPALPTLCPHVVLCLGTAVLGGLGTEQTSWSGTSRGSSELGTPRDPPAALGPGIRSPPPGSGEEEAGGNLVGAGWHLPPPTWGEPGLPGPQSNWVKTRCMSRCPLVSAGGERPGAKLGPPGQHPGQRPAGQAGRESQWLWWSPVGTCPRAGRPPSGRSASPPAA